MIGTDKSTGEELTTTNIDKYLRDRIDLKHGVVVTVRDTDGTEVRFSNHAEVELYEVEWPSDYDAFDQLVNGLERINGFEHKSIWDKMFNGSIVNWMANGAEAASDWGGIDYFWSPSTNYASLKHEREEWAYRMLDQNNGDLSHFTNGSLKGRGGRH